MPSIGRANLVEPRPVAPEAVATHALYERHASRIHSYCLHQLGSREEAEDAVQTTFMNAFRALRKGITPEAESAWLFKIAENVCLSRRRSSWRRGRIESPSDFGLIEEIVPGPNRQRDELIGIEDALAGMPEQQRRAILLREWQGLSYREIAEELEVTQAAVETLIFRARRSLAAGLEQPETVSGKRKGLRRALHAADFGSLVGVLKALLTGGAAVKATAAAVAVTAAAGAAITAHPERHDHAANARPAAIVAPAPAAAVGSSFTSGVPVLSASATPAVAERPVSPAATARSKAVLKAHRERAARQVGARLVGGAGAALAAPTEGASATDPPQASSPAPVAEPVATPPAAEQPVREQAPSSGGDSKGKDDRTSGTGGSSRAQEPVRAVAPAAATAPAAADPKPTSKDEAKQVAAEARQEARAAKQEVKVAVTEAKQDSRDAAKDSRDAAREAKQDARELARAPQTVAAPPVVTPAASYAAAPTVSSIPAPASDGGRANDRDRSDDKSNGKGNGKNRG